jgi:hypothetical protein
MRVRRQDISVWEPKAHGEDFSGYARVALIETALRRAPQIDPRNADARRWLAMTLPTAFGKRDGALREQTIAARMHPLAPIQVRRIGIGRHVGTEACRANIDRPAVGCYLVPECVPRPMQRNYSGSWPRSGHEYGAMVPCTSPAARRPCCIIGARSGALKAATWPRPRSARRAILSGREVDRRRRVAADVPANRDNAHSIPGHRSGLVSRSGRTLLQRVRAPMTTIR